MRTLHVCLLVLILGTVLAMPAMAEDGPPPGFTSLFNSRDLTGWRVPEGDNGHWKVLDGVIDYDACSEAKDEHNRNLWTEDEYGDFILHVEWRIKSVDVIPPLNTPYILPDGSHAKGPDGKLIQIPIQSADSGVFLRGFPKCQVNIWNWPIGSGELYSYRTDAKQPPEVRAGATPRTQADKPVGQWNAFDITMRGDRVTVVLNGIKVIDNTQVPGVPAKGRIGFQHHGGKKADGKYGPLSSLLQYRNIYIKELSK